MRIITTSLLLLLAAALPAEGQSAKNAAAESPVAQRPEFRQAVQALKDKLPEVAASRLKKLLASGSVKGAATGPVKLLLAEALVRSGKAEEGLAAASVAETRGAVEAGYWRGVALAQMQRYAESEMELSALPAEFRYATEAAFTRASDAVARGNRKVYAEIGREFARFFVTCLDDNTFDAAKIAEGVKKLGYPMVELDADGKVVEKKGF